MQPPKLRDVLDEIMRRNKWHQIEMGKALGITQSMVSKMRYSPDWELHWNTMFVLLQLCHELGMKLTACKLPCPTAQEVIESEERNASAFNYYARGRTGKAQETGHGALPPRGTEGRKRRVR
jgi:DNA-binding Xre family transcriptional regulator